MRETKKPSLWEWAMKLVFWVGLLAAGIGPPILIYNDQSETGWALLVSAVVVLLGTRFEAIEELSIGPLKARLTQKVEEADRTLEGLKELAQLTASISLSLVKRSSFLSGFNDEEQERIMNDTLSLLRKLKIEEDQIDEAFAYWHKVEENFYVRFLLGSSSRPVNFSDEEHTEWVRLYGGEIRDTPSPEECEDFLRRTNTLDEYRQGLLEDYRFYQEHRRHRRPQVWAARNNPIPLEKPAN